MPQIIMKGRFWAEEGKVFFSRAWDTPLWEALWEPYGGYLNLVANASAILAHSAMPLRLAPYVTIAVGLVFQLFPPLLILTAGDRWLRPWPAKMAAILLLLFMPGSEEIWLQTLHCQFELALCCGIILALEPATGFWGAFRMVLLMLAPLCGPAVIALCPLFIFRAALERDRSRIVQALLITAGCLIQYFFFLSTTPGRAYALHPVINLSVITVKHLAIPFLGIIHAEHINAQLRADFHSSHIPIIATLLPIAVFVPFGLAVVLRGVRTPSPWFFAGFAATAAISYFGAIGGGLGLLDVLGNERYAIVPQLLLELSLLSFAASGGFFVALVPRLAVVWLILVGVTNYREVNPFVSDGPAWRPEVALWESDPHHALRLWPEGWSVILRP